MHNDGRIYRRIADSSDPKPETDRSRLDLLIERGKTARSRLADRVTRIPTVSKGEENQCYIHLSITSDPYETMGHWYSAGVSKFSERMHEPSIRFDNIYSKSRGFVARQVQNNDPQYRLLTWEFSRHCHSFITIPIQRAVQAATGTSRPEGTIYDAFMSVVRECKLDEMQVLDLNLVLIGLLSIVRRHRRLVWHAKVKGPFFVKAHLENIWRTVPFVDLPAFYSHIEDHGLPIVQDTDAIVPQGTSLETFVVLPERDAPETDSLGSTDEILDYILEAIKIGIHILEALGVPRQIMLQPQDLFLRYFNYNASSANDP